ncbi:hypothetical protein Pmani_025603 [Petrolisthes manimaculis]|uniref:Uncharacterized protein n=1 Tax=Petrolisthes manimaculis TaxID=1843537 RepID=A0AAE1P6E5_9EUCA|nr:hypothetical protein Pmani_025603 [Petrolisthes manimaculis]
MPDTREITPREGLMGEELRQVMWKNPRKRMREGRRAGRGNGSDDIMGHQDKGDGGIEVREERRHQKPDHPLLHFYTPPQKPFRSSVKTGGGGGVVEEE